MFIQTEIEQARAAIRADRKDGADHQQALNEWQAGRQCARVGNTLGARAHYRACLQHINGVK